MFEILKECEENVTATHFLGVKFETHGHYLNAYFRIYKKIHKVTWASKCIFSETHLIQDLPY